VEHSAEREEKLTFSEHLRIIFRQPLQLAGEFLHKLGIKPNVITGVGVVGTLVGSIFVALGQLPLGGIIIMVMSAVDVLDGAVARAGRPQMDAGDLHHHLVRSGGSSRRCSIACQRHLVTASWSGIRLQM